MARETHFWTLEGFIWVRSFRERYGALNNQSRPRVERQFAGAAIEHLESGQFLQNRGGEIFVAEARRQDPHVSALATRHDLRSSLYLRDQQQFGIQPQDILFLDTETTGLAGGTGTHAFLVGIGYFEGPDLVLRQFFMRSPSEELAMLEELRSLLDRFRLLVTFNGKSFDWPLIDTRFLMHGYRLEFDFDHLDLLHPARRIWKYRLASCSLTSLEQGVFGVTRQGDVPGYLIPQLYFDYLRDSDARRLSPVFSHNREDIVTLARLMEVMLAAEVEPDVHLDFAEDRVGMGLALISAGETERGYQTLSKALSAGVMADDVRRRGEVAVWRLMKRHGHSHDGIEMLEDMCRQPSSATIPDLFPFVELAKHYEHVARDYGEAERIVERAIRLADLHGRIQGREELIHRLQRIRRKMLAHRD